MTRDADTLKASDHRIGKGDAERSERSSIFKSVGFFENVRVNFVQHDPERDSRIQLGAFDFCLGYLKADAAIARSFARDRRDEEHMVAVLVCDDNDDAARTGFAAFGFALCRLPFLKEAIVKHLSR